MTANTTARGFIRLQDALSTLSSMTGNGTPADAILQGFPAAQGKLQIHHLPDAATRAGLKLVAVNTGGTKSFHCPLLFCSSVGQSIIITEILNDGRGLALSDGGAKAAVSVAGLTKAGFAQCWSVLPAKSRDARVENHAAQSKSHWIIEALWMDKSIVGGVVLATVFTNILALATPLIMMNVMDRVVSHAAFATLWALSIGGVMAIALDFVLRTLRGTLIDKASAAGDITVNNRIFAKVLGTRMAARQSSVGVQSNTLREFESLREMSNSAAIATLGDLPFALLFFLVIGMVAGWMVVVPLAMVPVLFLSGYYTQRKLNALVSEYFKDTAQKNAVAVEVLSNMETIKAHVGESWAAAKWETAVASYLRHSKAMRWWTALGSNMITALQSLTTIALLIAGVYLISAGQLSNGALFASIMLSGRALTPIAQIAGLITKYHHAKTAFNSLRHLVDAAQDRPEGANFLQTSGRINSIILDKVSLQYRKDGPFALKNLTLEINAGERIGIIGGIGSGKSSLLRILTALRQPTSGNMSVDGVPMQQIDPVMFRGKLGTAFREEGFFFGTIRENLSFHRPGTTDDELVAAAHMAGAMDWIKALPTAFDTRIGEQGAGLSSGQRQTLALARAFLGQPDVLILDEPTSDLDSKTEAQLVARLGTLPDHQTLIVVTHRPAVIEACTRLIVIDSGGVFLDGDKSLVLSQLRNAVQRELSVRAA